MGRPAGRRTPCLYRRQPRAGCWPASAALRSPITSRCSRTCRQRSRAPPVAAASARHIERGPLRSGWLLLVRRALWLYLLGLTIGTISWLHHVDPFPGPADVCYCAFDVVLALAAISLIRAAAVRVPWVQFSLDGTIFIVGFGAFFWFLVIRPAASATELDFLRQALSLGYAALDCVLLLMLGMLLLTGGRRVPLLLLTGFATMFLGDILWSLAKVRGYYLPGQFQDVLYLCCYAPIAHRRTRADAYPGSPGAQHVQHLGCARTLAAVCGDARRLPGPGVLQPQQHRRPCPDHDHGRIRADAAAHGAPGRHAARGCAGARTQGGTHRRGPLRLAHRQRLRRDHDRRRRRAGALRVAGL